MIKWIRVPFYGKNDRKDLRSNLTVASLLCRSLLEKLTLRKFSLLGCNACNTTALNSRADLNKMLFHVKLSLSFAWYLQQMLTYVASSRE